MAKVLRWSFPLRADFKKRKLNRERAMIVCLRRRKAPDEPVSAEVQEDSDLGEERFEPTYDKAEITIKPPTPAS